MGPRYLPTPEDAARLVLGEAGESSFCDDFERRREDLADAVRGARVLFIGGAGTIGLSALSKVIRLGPALIHVVDISENALAEVARRLRSASAGGSLPSLRLTPLDYGSPLMDRLIREQGPFDLVMNFAALKHVRSEKSELALLRLLEVNYLGMVHLLESLSRWHAHAEPRVFSISTDKAADPVSAMGASKRLMEGVLFSPDFGHGSARRFSARFANVAFSAGSLPESWLLRLQRGEPLVCPEHTRRFFVSPASAGCLCVMATLLMESGRVAVPSEAAGVEEMDLTELAERTLSIVGLKAVWTNDEDEARQSVAQHSAAGRYPILLTQRDTAGEKEREKFIGAGESTGASAVRSLDWVQPVPLSSRLLRGLADTVRAEVGESGRLTKRDLIAAMGRVLPVFDHLETGVGLDDRM